MLKNENIICISSIDWDFIWQGHQEIMSTLDKNGNTVLFIENTGVRVPGLRDVSRIKERLRNWFKGVKGIRKESDNLYVYSPLILPFPYCRFARWINKHLILSVLNKWMNVMDFTDPVVWTFLPTPLTLDIADGIDNKLFVYYCIDNFSASSPFTKKIRKSEVRLLKRADLVFATSLELYNYCSEYSAKVYRFPFGVSFDKFERIRLKNDTVIPDDLKSIKAPIIGYVGGVHKWVDQALIKYLAEKYTQYSFVFIGPLQTDVSALINLKNVYFLGKKEHEDLPLYIKYFNAGIIPYTIADYTKNVYPTKLNEYLAFGKPVISTLLPELAEFNREFRDIAYVADTKEKFGEYIYKAVNENNETFVKNRIEIAKNNSWESRIEEMSCLIQGEIEIKKIDAAERWKERFIDLYRIARRKILRLAISCILIYALLFNTSFLWFIASPLRVSETPQKSDVILVFGGGVGETGSPGKSTIERARYAAELYKQGYAGKIIFSSGYTYIYNDAENMKLFAVSIGVPWKDIILEEKANSTYENVVFSKKILDQNNYKRVILVSSPYNMRRAKLILDRQCRDLSIIYAPVNNSQFYSRENGVKLEQIKAIIHEYLGIIYYLLKY